MERLSRLQCAGTAQTEASWGLGTKEVEFDSKANAGDFSTQLFYKLDGEVHCINWTPVQGVLVRLPISEKFTVTIVENSDACPFTMSGLKRQSMMACFETSASE
jgi:hypothetical protein